MAHRLDTERVLATVDWADAVLLEHQVDSGYAVDAKLHPAAKRATRAGSETASETSQPGKFARYQRGDCVPSLAVLQELDTRDGLAVGRFQHPLYTVLRVGWEGRETWQGRDALDAVLVDVDRWLQVRLTRYLDLGWTYEVRLPTPRLLLDLAVQGTGHALVALLCYAIQLGEYGKDPRPAIERALQCMALTFGRGEFRLTWPLVAARVRQQVLDRIPFDDAVADTAAVDLQAAVVSARTMFEQMRSGRLLPQAQRRQQVRAWLREHDWMRPTFVSPEAAALSRQRHPVPLRMQPIPRGQFGHIRDFGRRGRSVLAAQMGDYVRVTAPDASECNAAPAPGVEMAQG